MNFVRACTRPLLLAALALPVAGCGGCQGQVTVEWPDPDDEANREWCGQIYLMFQGPGVVASAVGAAAAPNGWGGLSALGTEMARRKLAEREFDEPDNLAAIAGAVGAGAPPGGRGGLSVLGTIAIRGDRVEHLGKHWHLPSLFEAQANRPTDRAVR